MSECKQPGLCECQGMSRCEGCGYTQHDKDYWLDHKYCDDKESIRHWRIGILERMFNNG